MNVVFTRMSSKGQVVIPAGIRKRLDAAEGTVFAVVGTSDSLLFKKVSTPSKEELLKSINRIAKETTGVLKTRGWDEESVTRTALRRGK